MKPIEIEESYENIQLALFNSARAFLENFFGKVDLESLEIITYYHNFRRLHGHNLSNFRGPNPNPVEKTKTTTEVDSKKSSGPKFTKQGVDLDLLILLPSGKYRIKNFKDKTCKAVLLDLAISFQEETGNITPPLFKKYLVDVYNIDLTYDESYYTVGNIEKIKKLKK